MPSDQPWAPFPVQDWSTMPHDPLAPAAVRGASPERRPRRWWPPLVALLIMAVLLGTVAYAGSRDPVERLSSAGRFLPADGTAAYEQVEKTAELKTETTRQVTESARLSGLTAVLSGDTGFGVQVFANRYSEGADLRVWRTTSTPVDRSATTGQTTGQTTAYYRVRDAVELIGESAPDGALVFQPGLVELPAAVRPGQAWSSAGSAGTAYDYRADLRSAAGATGCLDVSGEIRFLTKAGDQQQVVTVQRTWCPGQGVVASVDSSGSTATRTSRLADQPAPPALGTVTTVPTWADPARWSEQAQDTRSVDPTFGEAEMNGTPANLPPVRTRSGLVVRALSSLDDLVALTPRTPTTWVSTWRVHVPGTVLAFAAFGDVVVVTTSSRSVLAYSATGVRLWQMGLDELVPTRPVRVSDTEAAVVALDGEVRVFSVVTGAVRWQAHVGSDVNVPAAAGAGLVVVMDRGGTVTALDAGTGTQRWTLALEGKAAAFVGNTLVVLQDQTAHAIDAPSGRSLWLRPFFGTLRQLDVFGDQFVLASDTATVVLDLAGVVRQRYGGSVALTVTAAHLVRWGSTEASVIDRAGAEVAHWPLPATTIAFVDRPAVALDDRVLLMGSAWTFRAWSAAAS